MIIAEGIATIPLTANLMGRPETVYPAVVWDDRGAVLIDTGYPGQADLVREQWNRLGLLPERLKLIAITHQDIDHIGSLPAIVEQSAEAVETMSSPFEKPYIEGSKRLLRLTPEAIDHAVASLPPAVSAEWREAFRRSLEQPPRAPIHTILEEGRTIDCNGGIETVDTPGHTPGHISFYHPRSRTLIAGDALTASDGDLYGPDPLTTLDPELAKRSLRKLLGFEIETVVCYHGGVCRGNIRKRLEDLL